MLWIHFENYPFCKFLVRFYVQVKFEEEEKIKLGLISGTEFASDIPGDSKKQR